MTDLAVIVIAFVWGIMGSVVGYIVGKAVGMAEMKEREYND